MIKRILVGLDGSDRASDVLAGAVDLARHYQATLTLVRAVGIPSGVPHEVWKMDAGSLAEFLRGQATSYLKSCSDLVPRGLLDPDLPLVVEVGVPWDAVCSLAGTTKADLVVVGSHGYGVIDRVLGTTAAKIVNHAPCAVFVVRPRAVPAR